MFIGAAGLDVPDLIERMMPDVYLKNLLLSRVFAPMLCQTRAQDAIPCLLDMHVCGDTGLWTAPMLCAS